MAQVYLGLGSNIGGREKYLAKARRALNRIGRIHAVSSIYTTAPWGNTDQPDFLNQCLMLETSLEPVELLLIIKQIEEKLGRKQRERWGPREIDIDILYYDDTIYKSADLIIPHSEVSNRAFALVPLNEIASDFRDPIHGSTICELSKRVDTSGVRIYEK